MLLILKVKTKVNHLTVVSQFFGTKMVHIELVDKTSLLRSKNTFFNDPTRKQDSSAGTKSTY